LSLFSQHDSSPTTINYTKSKVINNNIQKVTNVKKIENVQKLDNCGPDTHLSIRHADLVVQGSEVVFKQVRDCNDGDDISNIN
jgi:hypothetical protein